MSAPSSAPTAAIDANVAADPAVVCVPMTLNAFVLNETLFNSDRKSKIGPLNLPDYSGLGRGSLLKADVVPPVDLHAASPASINTRISDVAGTGAVRTDRLGVYLHWILPKAFRAGLAATESASEHQDVRRLEAGLPGKEGTSSEDVEFRPVPDRWFVFRYITNAQHADGTAPMNQDATAAKAFAIESNRIRKITDFGPDDDIETESTPFLDSGPNQGSHMQQDTFMGFKTDLESWKEGVINGSAPNDKKYHSPLTVVDSSNPLFPDYQPHNANVFSLHDDLTYLEGGKKITLIHAQVSYFVFGYYSNETQDPFYVDPKAIPARIDPTSGPTNAKILENCFMELRDTTRNANWLKSPASKSRLVCHGAMYNVIWDIAKVPDNVPAEKLARQFEDSHPIAVGVDMMDALEAYLEAHVDDKKPSPVHSLAALLESKQGDIHQLRQASKDLLRNRYNKTSGGAHWYLSKEKVKPAKPSPATDADILLKTTTPPAQPPTPSKAKDKSLQPPTATRFSKVAVALVHELNALQAQFDACLRHRDQLRFLLFCEWWKERAEPTSDETDSTKEQDSRKANNKDRVASLTSEIAKLGDPKAGDGKIGEIMGKIDLLMQHPSLASQLKSGVDTSFFARKDPSVVLIGPRSPWPSDSSSELLDVRLSSQIPLFDSEISLEKRQTLPKGWGNVLKDPLQPKGLIETLSKAAEPTFNAGDIVKECLPEVKAWLLSWSKIQKMKSDKSPTFLQDGLDHLLVEWVFLSGDTYASIDTILPPNYLKAKKAPKGATEQPPFDGRIHWNNTQAWFPLFVEWEAEYFHVPIDKWKIREEADGTIIGAIDRDQQLSSIKGIRNDVRVLSGRSLLQPQVSQTLKTQLKEVLKQSTPETESKEVEAKKQEVLDLLGDLPFLSTSLTGITDHLLTLVEGSHVAPHKIDIPNPIFSADTLALLDGATTDVSPYGRYLDFQHHRRDGKDRTHSPFKPVTHGQVRFTKLNIIDKFGQVVPALSPQSQGTDQDFIPLRPYTSKSVSCQPDPVSGPYFSNTVIQDPEGLCQFFQLSPSINQDARLNACFVVADDVNVRFGTEKIPAERVSKVLQPADHGRSKRPWRRVTEHENPIWGWAVVNFRDGGLQIYDGEGVFRAEALLRERKVYWLPPRAADLAGDEQSDDSDSDSDNDDAEPTANLASTQLDFFLQALKSAAYLKTLMDIIIRALDSLHPVPNSFSGEVAAVFGRPLALVNMSWSLELATQPMKDQSTFLEQSSSSGISVLDYDFSLRVGDRHNLNDGLVGYFEEVGAAAQKQRNTPVGASSSQTNGTKEILSAEPNTSTQDTNGIVNVDPAPFDFSCLRTEFGEKSDASKRTLTCDEPLVNLRPYFINPVEATADDYSYLRNQVMSVFAAIVDPFSDIFGYSMILPPKKLQIPRWTIEKAMKQMTPFMSVGPVLIPGDIPEPQFLQTAQLGSSTNGINGLAPVAKKDDKDPPTIPAHIPADGGWAWLQPVAVDDNAEEVEFLKINVRGQESKFQELDGPHTAVGGYLQLTTQPIPALVSSSRVHRAVDIGKFMGDDSLSLRLSGRGSCGGYAEETVEIAITLGRVQEKVASSGEKTKKANIARKLNRYSILVDLPSEKTRLKEARSPSLPIVFNTPLSVTYTRPLREYTLEVTVIDEETDLMFPIQLQIPVSPVDPAKVVSPGSTNSTPTVSASSAQPTAKILSARFSSLEIKGSVTVGQPFKGTLVVRDTRNNVRTGYDDRACIQFEDGPKPTIVSNGDSYSLTFPPFTEKGNKEIWAFIADQLIGNQPTTVNVLPDLHLDRCITRGSGIGNGLANEATNFELMLLDGGGSAIKDLNLKVDITAQSGAVQITSQVVKASSQNSWTSVTYSRPAVGLYSVAITVEKQHIPGSPFQLQSTATPVVWDISKTEVVFGGQNNQQVRIVLKDSAGSPYHGSIPNLQQLSLVASSIPPAVPVHNVIPLKSEYNDGTFEATLSLPPGSEWTFSVQSQLTDGTTTKSKFPGSTAVSKSGQLVSKPPVIQKIGASGDGLHSGKESSTAIISIECIDQTRQEVARPKDTVTVAITNRRGGSIPYSWTADKQISFTRPSATDSPCFVRIWSERSKSDIIEATNSPFNVRIMKASTSEEETAGSCSFLTISHTVGKLSHATAVVLDRGGKRRMIPSKVVIISDNDSFQIVRQNPLPNLDCTHSFSYIPKTPLITFDCIIDNAVTQTCGLPSAPLPKVTLGTGTVAIYPQEGMQIVSRIPFASGGGMKARHFRAMLYPSSVEAPQQCYVVTVRHVVGSEGKNHLRLEAEGMADLQRIPYTLRLTYQGRVLSTIGAVVTTLRPL